jgi:hypothetical protein
LFGWLFTTSHALPWITLAAGCAACVLTLATRVGRAIGPVQRELKGTRGARTPS